MASNVTCVCRELDDLAVVGMGDPSGLDDGVFSTFGRVRDHGGAQWWLHASICSVCGQGWMIAQDERIHDNLLLKRIDRVQMHDIAQNARWPKDFLRFEQVLCLERQSGKIARFLDARSPALIETAHDLRRERADISIEEIAYALAIPVSSAARLFKP